MEYKRDKIFSLKSILDQLVDYVDAHHKLPATIILPPDEYVYIDYLAGGDLTNKITSFLGIPLVIGDKQQDKPFDY